MVPASPAAAPDRAAVSCAESPMPMVSVEGGMAVVLPLTRAVDRVGEFLETTTGSVEHTLVADPLLLSPDHTAWYQKLPALLKVWFAELGRELGSVVLGLVPGVTSMGLAEVQVLLV